MSNPSHTRARERRWLLLAEEGSHSWMGRATDPDEEDVVRAAESLARNGVGGWIAVSEGDYWSGGETMTILKVRCLGEPKVAFDEAVDAFMAKRRNVLDGLSGRDRPTPSPSGITS